MRYQGLFKYIEFLEGGIPAQGIRLGKSSESANNKAYVWSLLRMIALLQLPLYRTNGVLDVQCVPTVSGAGSVMSPNGSHNSKT